MHSSIFISNENTKDDISLSVNFIMNDLMQLICSQKNNAILTMSTAQKQCSPICLAASDSYSSGDELPKSDPICSDENQLLSCEISLNVKALLTDLLDVIEVTESLLTEVDTSNAEVQLQNENCHNSQVFQTILKGNASSQPLCDTKYEHIISCSYPTTSVYTSFNFTDESKSTNVFKKEFQIQDSNSIVLKNDYKLDNDCFFAISQPKNSYREMYKQFSDSSKLEKSILDCDVSNITSQSVDAVCNDNESILNHVFVNNSCLSLEISISMNEEVANISKQSFSVDSTNVVSEPDMCNFSSIASPTSSNDCVISTMNLNISPEKGSQNDLYHYTQETMLKDTSLINSPGNDKKDCFNAKANTMNSHTKNIYASSEFDANNCEKKLYSVNSALHGSIDFDENNTPTEISSKIIDDQEIFFTSTPVLTQSKSSPKNCNTSKMSGIDNSKISDSFDIYCGNSSGVTKNNRSWFKFVNSYTSSSSKLGYKDVNLNEQALRKDVNDQALRKVISKASPNVSRFSCTSEKPEYSPSSLKQLPDAKAMEESVYTNTSNDQRNLFGDSLFAINISDMEKILEVEKSQVKSFMEDESNNNVMSDINSAVVQAEKKSETSTKVLINTASGQLMIGYFSCNIFYNLVFY